MSAAIQTLPGAGGALVPTTPGPNGDGREDALDKEARRARYVPWKEYLLNTSRAIEAIDREAELERKRTIVKMRKFVAGHQIGYVSRADNRWHDRKKRSEALYVDPVLAAMIETNVAQIVRSRPAYRVVARADDQVEKQEAARYATELLKDAHKTLLTASTLVREAKRDLQCSGEAYRLTYFDRNVEGTEVKRLVTETKHVGPQYAAWECPACDEIGAGPPPQACPTCQYSKVLSYQASGFEAEVGLRYEEVPVGDVRQANPDPLEMKVVGCATGKIADALAIVRDQMVPRCVLEQMFPGKKIPSTGTPQHLKWQQELQRDAPQTSQNAYEDSTPQIQGGEQFELIHFREIWLDVAVCGSYQFQRDEQLPDGTTIPKDTVQRTMKTKRGSFAKGTYYCHAGNEVLDIYPCDKRLHWTHCVNSTGDGFHGLGEWDLLPLQEMINVLVSLQFAREKFDSLSPTIVRSHWLKGGKLAEGANKPGAIIEASSAMPDEAPLERAFARVPPGANSGGSAILRQQLWGSMMYRTGADQTGTPGDDRSKQLGATTATAVVAARQQSEGRRGPGLALRAEMGEEQGYQILQQRKDNWTEEMYAALDKKVGGDAGRWFRESNVRRDFLVETVPESWTPTTVEERRQEFIEYLSIVAPYAAQDPNFVKAAVKRAGELWNGINIEDYQIDRVEAAVRLERLRKACDYVEREAGVPVYDATGAPNADVVSATLQSAGLVPEMPGQVTNAELDHHPVFIETATEWLKTSAGREASPFVRAGVLGFIQAHKQGMVEQAQGAKMDAYQAQLPDKAAEIIGNQLDAKQQQNIQGAQAEEAQGLHARQAEQQQQMQMRQAEHGQVLQERNAEHSAIVDAAASGAIPVGEAVALKQQLHG